jgi:prepilin-type N-terminal cleavage/methylation domain-containing protein
MVQKKRYENKVRGGFTLVEVLVTIGILVILLSATVGITRTGDQQVLLSKEQSLLLVALNRAKASALQTFFQPNHPCGYGIFIDIVSNSYTLFQDQPTNPSDCTTANHLFDAPGEVLTIGVTPQIYTLPPGVQFGSATNVSTVVYLPPNPDVFINNGALQIGIITLQSNNAAAVRSIQINNAGQITTL